MTRDAHPAVGAAPISRGGPNEARDAEKRGPVCWKRDYSTAKGGDAHVLMTLATYAGRADRDNSGQAAVTVKRIAKGVNLAPKTVEASLKRLKQAGHITTKYKAGPYGQNVYTIVGFCHALGQPVPPNTYPPAGKPKTKKPTPVPGREPWSTTRPDARPRPVEPVPHSPYPLREKSCSRCGRAFKLPVADESSPVLHAHHLRVFNKRELCPTCEEQAA